jgi:methylated-DNA-[protein]-cysteine S-methyltransferase
VGRVTAVATIATPCGSFTVVADDQVVLASGWTDDPAVLAGPGEAAEWARRRDLGPLTEAVAAYLDGDLTAIDAVEVAPRSGPFTDRVWAVLRAVPPGNTITYTQLAARSGRPGAARAAGSACGRNRAGLFVPCHRAQRGDGGLGGFRWGLAVKRWLLDHEASNGQLAGLGVVGVKPPVDDVLHR